MAVGPPQVSRRPTLRSSREKQEVTQGSCEGRRLLLVRPDRDCARAVRFPGLNSGASPTVGQPVSDRPAHSNAITPEARPLMLRKALRVRFWHLRPRTLLLVLAMLPILGVCISAKQDNRILLRHLFNLTRRADRCSTRLSCSEERTRVGPLTWREYSPRGAWLPDRANAKCTCTCRRRCTFVA